MNAEPYSVEPLPARFLTEMQANGRRKLFDATRDTTTLRVVVSPGLDVAQSRAFRGRFAGAII